MNLVFPENLFVSPSSTGWPACQTLHRKYFHLNCPAFNFSHPHPVMRGVSCRGGAIMVILSRFGIGTIPCFRFCGWRRGPSEAQTTNLTWLLFLLLVVELQVDHVPDRNATDGTVLLSHPIILPRQCFPELLFPHNILWYSIHPLNYYFTVKY